MMKMRWMGILATAGLLATTGVQAAIVNWTANINAAQEVPANASPGTGFAFGTLDSISGLLNWDVSWSGVSGPLSGMHFHGPAAPGVNAGVKVSIGGISGLTSASIGSTTILGANITDFMSDLWYINLHTVQSPGGEIRGQVRLSTVPEPATLALLGVSLFGLVATRRRPR